jgi:hypothetical protein
MVSKQFLQESMSRLAEVNTYHCDRQSVFHHAFISESFFLQIRSLVISWSHHSQSRAIDLPTLRPKLQALTIRIDSDHIPELCSDSSATSEMRDTALARSLLLVRSIKFGSSLQKAGKTKMIEIWDNGKKHITLGVYGFHPSVYLREDYVSNNRRSAAEVDSANNVPRLCFEYTFAFLEDRHDKQEMEALLGYWRQRMAARQQARQQMHAIEEIFAQLDRVLDKQASMLATICLFAWLVRVRCLFACEINCLLASACKHYSSIRA